MAISRRTKRWKRIGLRRRRQRCGLLLIRERTPLEVESDNRRRFAAHSIATHRFGLMPVVDLSRTAVTCCIFPGTVMSLRRALFWRNSVGQIGCCAPRKLAAA